jgi:peroxiredoxin
MSDGLVAAVTVVSALTLLNLLLTYGVIRRLREHEKLLAGAGSPAPAVDLPVGAPLPEFTAVTSDGRTVTHQDLRTGTAWVAFFSPACTPCREQLPLFADAVRDAGQDGVLVVISRDGTDPAALAEFGAPLPAACQVVVEDHPRQLATAFGVIGEPTFLLFKDGTLAAREHVVDDIFTSARA